MFTPPGHQISTHLQVKVVKILCGIHQHAARHRFGGRNICLLMISGQNVVAGEGGAHVGHAVGLPHALTGLVLVLLLNS